MSTAGKAGSGWVQDFDSPNAAFGAGAIMHGDTVAHNPADNRANINAMWIYGKFWQEYIGSCVPWGGGPAVQYIHLLGYPTTERYVDLFGIIWQRFQHGNMYWLYPYNPNDVQIHDLNDQKFGPNCDDPLPPPPTPTPTNTPTKVPTSTRTPTPTYTPTATATPVCGSDADGDGVCDPVDNCPSNYNPGQANSDARIGNGRHIAGDDGTSPNSDAFGDACDDDDDNDSLPDASDPDPGGDITYDDDGDGYPACLGGSDAQCTGGTRCIIHSSAPAYDYDGSDDGPSWDADCDARRDGISAFVCSLLSDSVDTDGDRLPDRREVCKWGTSPVSIDSDGDGINDCVEVFDVNGNGMLDFLTDLTPYARAVQLAPSDPSSGKDGDFDLNGNNVLEFTSDLLPAARTIQNIAGFECPA